MDDVKQVTSGTKLESIGTVKTVVGTVKAVDASGAERILQAGDKVYANETIVTADGGLVLIEFADGSHLDLASASQIVLDTDVFNPANVKGEELTAEQIQEMIAAGADPTAIAEATAAGAGAGDEGGSSFVVVDFNNTQGNVTSGVDTLGIPGPESTTFTELPPVEDEVPVVSEVPPTIIIGSLLEIELDVEAQGIPEGSDVIYTVTLDQVSTGDITVTLSNGAVIVISAGQLSGSSDPIPVQGDDPYVDPSQEAVSITSMTGGGAGEVLQFNPAPVEFDVIDTLNTVTVVLSASESTGEDGGVITYTASLVDGDGNPVTTNNAITVTLTNGEVITIAANASSGSVDTDVNLDDVVLETDSISNSIDTVEEENAGTDGAFENLVADDSEVTTVITDDSDTVTVVLSATESTGEDGGVITYTASLVDGNGDPVVTNNAITVTLTNGEEITIAADASSGSVDTDVNLDDVVLESDSISNSIDTVVEENAGTDGAFENLVADDSEVTTVITDDSDAVTVVLSASESTGEDGGVITYTASLVDGDGNPVTTNNAITVTLTNGEEITIAADASSGSVDTDVNLDDVVLESDSISNSIDTVVEENAGTDGAFENLVADDSEVTTVITDDSDTVTATLTTSTTEISEDGGSIVYTVTLSGGPGAVDPDNDLVIELANGEEVTIEAGEISGSYTKVYSNADITDQQSITNSIAGIVSGGDEYENLVTTGSTEVGVDYGVTITDLTPMADGGDVIVDEDDLADGTDGSDSTTAPGTFTITTPDGVQSLTIGDVAVITNGVFTAVTITSALGNTLNVTSYNAGTGEVTYSYTLNDNTTTHAAASGENSVYEDFAVVVTDTDNDFNSATLSVQIVDDVPVTTFAEDTTVSTVGGSDTGSLGITIGADRDGASVTLLIDGEEANGQQVVDTNGNAVTSDGDLLYYFSDGAGGLYVATEEDGDSVLEITPTINSDGTTSYTVTVTGQLDANTESSTAGNVSVTLIESTTETVTLTGNFSTGTLKPGNYTPTETPVGGTITGTNDTGEVIGTMDFYFKGFKDSDKVTGEYVYGQAEDVSVSGQNVGVNSNHIDNTNDATANTNNDDGDGELLKLFFSKSVTDLSMLFDQLDAGETAYYSIDQGATWTSVLGTGTGGSNSSDEVIDIDNSTGFTELWIRGSEGSSFGILTNTIVAEWEETVTTETSHTYNVSVIDVTGEDQTVTLDAQASDGDSDLSDLVSFDTTLDSAVDYDAVSVSGSTISNFSAEQGDQLDFSAIFNDMGMDAATLESGGYLTVNVDDATNTATISVDLDASGSAYTSAQVVTLTNLDSGITATQIINQIITQENP